MAEKLRILMCSEASFINSGFGNYTRELLTRLYKTQKYSIAEFASYGMVNDPRDRNIPWKYYANAVKDNDPRYSEYSSRGDNQFGRWRFDKVVLDFKPHVVIDIRDYWMNAYQAFSPLRPFYNWILMPTVDSAPQQESWIDTFMGADAVFTYSDWGADILKKQSNNKVNYIDTVSPGVDLNTFKIHDDKLSIKNKLGLPVNSYIVGSVMRNQKRKLLPEIFYSFRKALDTLYNDGLSHIADKLFLYMHTSYPDAGWDIPELLKEHRLLNKVYFTYCCIKCKHTHASVFSHPSKVCKKCMEPTSRFSSVTNGVSDQDLSEIYNTFDLYLQYAICEGFGMPQVEAGACGVPIATVDYSAMVDIINKLEAYPIKIKSYFKELETKAIRVYPDNDILIKYICKFFRFSPEKRNQMSKHVRNLTEKYYNWDIITEKWEKFLDRPDLFNTKRSWDEPIKYLNQIEFDKNISFHPKDYFDILNQICSSNIDNSSIMSKMHILDMLRDSSYGFNQSGMSYGSYDISDMLNNIKILIENHNQTEFIRSNNIRFNDDFIEYARIKSNE